MNASGPRLAFRVVGDQACIDRRFYCSRCFARTAAGRFGRQPRDEEGSDDRRA